MSAKYQVFVSSTFTDLKEERDLVIKAILEMGHIPVGMEMFSAADEEQWNIIKKKIDQSDYYVVLVAYRYGSCDTSGISYTEKEYDYALSKGIPSLGFIIEDSISWPREKSEVDPELIKKLDSFKNKVRGKPVSFWKNGEDLYGRCSIALMKAFNAYPREGWVRASQVQDAAAAKEIVRLSSENADLRSRISFFEKQVDEETLIEKSFDTLRRNSRRLSVWKLGANAWENVPDLTLYQIFETLAPELQVEADLHSIASFMATQLGKVPIRDLRASWPAPRNQIRSILADFWAMNCIKPSGKKKPVSDMKEYWTLSDFGIKLLSHMRLRRLEDRESLKKVETSSEEDSKTDT